MKAIVVLGAAVWRDGPSPTLKRRCHHAARVWASGGYDFVVVCGGLGLHPPTEAAVMAEVLAGQGVPPDKIMQEDQSTTTLENLRFARSILRDKGCKDIVIVTDGYHGPRARLVARTLGLKAGVSAPSIRGSHLPTQVKQYTREALALPAYAARLAIMRIKGPLP